MTLDQIEDLRAGHTLGPSLQKAAKRTNLPFRQCPKCHGNGYTKATLLASGRVIEACKNIKEQVPIQFDKCTTCDGAGGWIYNADKTY